MINLLFNGENIVESQYLPHIDQHEIHVENSDSSNQYGEYIYLTTKELTDLNNNITKYLQEMN